MYLRCSLIYEIDAKFNTCGKGCTVCRANPGDYCLMNCKTKKEKQLDLFEWVGMKELIIKALTIDAVCIHIKEMHNQKVFC